MCFSHLILTAVPWDRLEWCHHFYLTAGETEVQGDLSEIGWFLRAADLLSQLPALVTRSHSF